MPRGDPARVAASPRRARAILLDKTTRRGGRRSARAGVGASQDSTCRVFDTNVTTLGATRTIIRAYRASPRIEIEIEIEIEIGAVRPARAIV